MAKKPACKIVYQAINNNGPDNNNMFKICEGTHALRSHSSQPVDIPRTNTKFGDPHFAVTGGKLWNTIPENLKSAVSDESFKKQIRKYTGFGC